MIGRRRIEDEDPELVALAKRVVARFGPRIPYSPHEVAPPFEEPGPVPIPDGEYDLVDA